MHRANGNNGQHDDMSREQREPLAIVGIGCRFPGGGNGPRQFWDLLANGIDAITEVPADRWDADLIYHPDSNRAGKTYSRWGGFVDGIDQFDAGFFGISPREATQMDPQQRLLMEVCYEAIEDAGIQVEGLSGTSAGVFVGISTHDYADIQGRDRYLADFYTNSGGALSIAANRLSYAFNLRGPSLAVDTACSSALVAVHLAAQSLWRNECEIALVGGVNCILTPEPTLGFSRANMLSPNGRCQTFDAKADGYVRAEGAGVVILKPLSDALSHGDSIYAVIRDTGINQDGRTNGLTLPNEEAQEALLRQIYTRSGIDPDHVVYVEAHGTGTPAGDPIEAKAIGRVLGRPRTSTDALPIGSVKTNIGHLEAASGIAGLIKAALILKHGKLAPNLHFSEPSPQIPFDEMNLRVPRALEDLPGTGTSIVGVNSFGFGGTNAHTVLERAPVSAAPLIGTNGDNPERRGYVVPISARNAGTLQDLASAYRDLATEHSDDPSFLANLSGSLAHRRSHHDHRLALAVRTTEELKEQLGVYLAGETRPTISTGHPQAVRPQVGFVFSGMGPQWWGMGRQLLEQEPVFREAVEKCDSLFRALASWSIVEELRQDEATSRMSEAEVAQPCNFALQVGLWALLKSWGICADAIVGHSAGEVAAAYAAQILNLEDAVSVIYHRSRLQQRATGQGRMLAVGQSLDALSPVIEPWEDRVSVAAVNSSESLTLSGDRTALETIEHDLTERQVFARFLDVSVPYHSHFMDPLREELVGALDEIEPRCAAVPFYSVVEGRLIDGGEVDAAYWWRNVRRPVRFADAISKMLDDGIETFVELSPSPVLGRSILESAKGREAEVRAVATLRRNGDEQIQLLSALGTLYTLGQTVNWEAVAPRTSRSIELPSYRWQRDRFWIESERSSLQRLATRSHPFLDYREWSSNATWETDLDLGRLGYLKDHAIKGDVVFPAAAYLEMACAALNATDETAAFEIEEVEFRRLLSLKEGQACLAQIALDRDGRFSISSRPRVGQSWTANVQGIVRTCKASRPARRAVSPTRFRARAMSTLSGEACYDLIATLGLQYGPSFQGVSELSLAAGEALGRISVPSSVVEEQASYHVHPAVLDACFHALVGIAFAERREAGGPFVPTKISRLRLYGPIREDCLWSYVKLTRQDRGFLEGDFVIFNDSGKVLAEITGFHCQQLPEPRVADGDAVDGVYSINWIPKSLPSARPRDAEFIGSPTGIASQVTPPRRLETRFNRKEHYTVVDPWINRLCTGYVLDALGKLGWRPNQGETFQTVDIAQQLGIDAQYHELLGRMLEFLAQDKLIQNDEAGWEVIQTPGPINPATDQAELEAAYPEYEQTLSLIARCGSNLDQVLSGRLDPLGLVFPDGSTADLGRFYEASPFFDVYNSLMREAISAIVDKLPAGRSIRILEIGAGTGGTAAHVLPILPPDRTEYVFTDVSGFFFPAARKRFANFPFVEYRTLDIENDPVAQGFDAHSFDVIIAADVVHATRDLVEALTNTRSLLASNGILALLEIARESRLIEIIFGPLKGWWRFTDRDLRPSHPWVDGATWQRLFTELDYPELAVLNDSSRWRPDHSVYLATGPRLALEDSPVETTREDSSGWLIFSDQSGYGDALADLAQNCGQRCVRVLPSTRYARTGVDTFQLRPDHARDMSSLLDDLAEDGFVCRDVVHAWGLDAPSVNEATVDDLSATDQYVSLTLLTMVQALARLGGPQPRLYVATRNAQAVGKATVPDVTQATVGGLARVIMNEHVDLRCTLVDISIDADDASSVARTARLLFDEISADAPDQEVVLRDEGRFVARVVPRKGPAKTSAATAAVARSFKLDIERKGMLDALFLRPVQSPRIGPLDVEIEVEAAALNFRDVLKALGMYPTEPGAPFWLGDECSGVVRRVGRDVTEFVPGDRVIAIGPGCFGSRVTANSDYVVRMPVGLAFEQAAGIPIVWLTTHYALNHLARLSSGQRILIHSAAGGVGLAAIQFAQLAGAEVFATAGSKEKRAYLRSLGVKHVYDSRSLEFADRIRATTHGEGIDVVLNSLAGDYIPTSMSLLRPTGRFIELGKIDLYQNSKIGLWPFRSGLSFTAVDMSWLMEHEPAFCKSLLEEIVAGFEAGRLKPLPVEVFPLADAVGAFRTMAQAKHIGKIVLNTKDVTPPLAAPRRGQSQFQRNASYLITGGLGGFGLELASWMVDQGARNLVLSGRSGVHSPQAELTVARLKRRGARVEVIKADVGREGDVAELIKFVDSNMPPLRGVFHAAMVLDDAFVLQLNDRRFLSVVEPKAYGAWNLHQQTKSRQLDHFVLFSSLASVVGNIGQANYSAANAFLDGLAHYRRALGLPGLAVNWGPIGEVGFVARNPEIARQLERTGFVGYKPADALALLKLFLEDGDTQTAAIRLNFRNFAGHFNSDSVNQRFSHIFGLLAADGLDQSKRSQGASSTQNAAESDDWQRMMTLNPGNGSAAMLQSIAAQMGDAETGSATRLQSAASTILAIPEGERLDALTDVLKQQFAAVTGIAVDRLDGQQPIASYNLDSLMRLELLLRVEQQLGVRLEDDAISQGVSFARLAANVLTRLTEPGEPVEANIAEVSRLR